MRHLISGFVTLVFVAFAFQTQAQMKFGLKAGINAAGIKQNFNSSQDEYDTNMRLGFHIGATVDYGVSDVLSVQPGLLLSSKGYSSDLKDGLDDDETIKGYDRHSFNYLEIPINFAYKMNDLQFYAGPYLAFGIGGKNKWDYTYEWDGDSENYSDEYAYKAILGDVGEGDLGDDEEAYSALDFGLNLGVGYETGPILLNLGYSLGLGNLTPGYEDYDDYDPNDYKISNRVITISASYFF
jgi:hypothetical protein